MPDFAYDRVAYPSYSHVQSHPNRLAAMARLFGVTHAASPERCSVLEIGCGDGVNLLGIGYAWTGSRCVGIDLSSVAIARGQAIIDELRLPNVRLIAGDVLATDATSLGAPFDYVIAHGFYSWTPPEARDAALRLCRAALADTGLAYFGYDVLPGSQLKLLARQIMRFAAEASGETDPLRRVQFARAALGAMADVATTDPWTATLTRERERLGKMTETGLFHDDLSDAYAAVTVAEFLEHAARHGLAFVGESDPADVFPPRLSPKAAQLIDRLSRNVGHTPDRVRREQATDMVRGRRFRQSILAPSGVAVQDKVRAEDLCGLRLCGRFSVDPAPAGATGSVTFRGDRDATATVHHPAAIAALRQVARVWPASVAYDDVVAAALQDAGVTPGNAAAVQQATQTVAGTVLLSAGARMVELSIAPAPSAASLDQTGDRPRASRLAQLLSRTGEHVCTLSGQTVRLQGDAARHLLQMLDGSRTVEQLITDFRPLLPGMTHDAIAAELRQKIAQMLALRLVHPA